MIDNFLLILLTFIYKVFYNDDQIEDLALSTLDILLRNDSWRLQVLIIQGYIPAMSSQVGFFSAENKVNINIYNLIMNSNFIFKRFVPS